MKQIFIDITSKNCMFNSVEPQGSFLFHRFGKRAIPEEHIDIKLLQAYLDKEKPEQIVLESVFGDPLEYKHLTMLLDYCKSNNIGIVCICNGYSNNFDLTKGHDIYFMFKVYGSTESFDTFLPDHNINRLINNLSYCNKIQYHLYEQNLCDVENIYNTGKEIEFVRGPLVHFNINHIITSNGTWLHDINGLNNLDIDDLSYENLLQYKDTKIVTNQTMNGYHLLKNYVIPIEGQSILDTTVYHLESKTKYKEQVSISYKGHVFKSIEERNIVTNAYIPDWKVEEFSNRDQYYTTLLSVLSEFANNKQLTI